MRCEYHYGIIRCVYSKSAKSRFGYVELGNNSKIYVRDTHINFAKKLFPKTLNFTQKFVDSDLQVYGGPEIQKYKKYFYALLMGARFKHVVREAITEFLKNGS